MVNLRSIYRCYCNNNNNIARLTTFTVLPKYTQNAQNTTPSGMHSTGQKCELQKTSQTTCSPQSENPCTTATCEHHKW